MGARFLIICASSLLVTGCFKERDHSADSAKQIHQMFDRWAKAFDAKDVDGVMAMYAPGATLTAYDIVPPLQFRGADAYRRDYAGFFSQFDGPIHVDTPDMKIETSGDVALAYGLEHLTGKMKGGAPVDIWLRYTEGLKRIGDQWRVVHEHISVPVDMATGKAALDLKP